MYFLGVQCPFNNNYYCCCFDLIKLHEVHTLVHMEDRAVVDGIEKYGGWSLVVVGSLSYSYLVWSVISDKIHF